MTHSTPNVIAIVLLTFLLPICILLGFFSHILHGNEESQSADDAPVSPWRWFFAFALPIYIVKRGLTKKSLDKSGAVAAFFVGFVLTLTSYGFFFSLLTFFLVGSAATRHKGSIKKKVEGDFKEAGQRNWAQVVCNGGVAVEFALIILMDIGIGEQVIDFSESYNASWLSVCVVGALACCCGDTLASELGVVYSRGQPRLITTFSKVPLGTNGGISLPGTVFSTLGGAVVGLSYYVSLLLFVDSRYLQSVPPQYPIIIVGAIMGLLGSTIDSLLGATIQFSGIDTSRGVIVDHAGPRVEHINGIGILDNHSVNLLSSLLAAVLTPHVAMAAYSNFS